MLHFGELSLTVLVALTLLLAVNFATSGMFEINPVEPFLAFADQGRLSRWTSPYMVLWIIEGFPHKLTSFSLRTHELGMWAKNLLHLKEFHWLNPLRYSLAICMVPYLSDTRLMRPGEIKAHLRLMAGIVLLVGCGLVMSLTMDQPISIARYFIFTSPLLLVGLVVLAMVAIEMTVHPRRRAALYVVFAVFAGWQAWHGMKGNRPPGERFAKAVLPFTEGARTYEDYYASRRAVFTGCRNGTASGWAG